MKQEPKHQKFRRIILKLSGEFFGGQATPLNQAAIDYTVEQIASARKMDAKIGVVVGAGNIIRGRDAKGLGQIDADLCGMMGTVINGLILCSVLKKSKHRVKMSSALGIDGIAERFHRSEDLAFYDAGGIIVFVAGTGNPLFTTDTAAALRAAELNADVLIKGTKVAGVYSADPHKHKAATFYRHLTPDQAIAKNLRVMDLTAFNICREAHIPICVYNFMEHGLSDVLAGKKIGTIISGG
ncbi:MAG: uridine monophosphate kinase [candidate division WOR-3 bacterium]|jgi:uridylate kinase